MAVEYKIGPRFPKMTFCVVLYGLPAQGGSVAEAEVVEHHLLIVFPKPLGSPSWPWLIAARWG